MRITWKRYLVLAAALAGAALSGCSKDDGSTSVTNPNPEKFQPKGIVQGVLTDATTQQPIAGAVVDMGVGRAATNASGQFVIYNVPANTDEPAGRRAASEGGWSYGYTVTIDMRGVSSPVNMGDGTAKPRYPDFVYRTGVEITWTTLKDAGAAGSDNSDDEYDSLSATLSMSNHATPVDNLVSNVDWCVGKLSTSLSGCVVNKDGTPAGADFTVEVWTVYGSDNSTTGAGSPSYGKKGNKVAQATTDAAGQFTISGLEADQDFVVKASNATLVTQEEMFRTGLDGSSVSYACNPDGSCKPLVAVTKDSCPPTIVSVTPERGVDLADKEGQTVVITFDQPIKTTTEYMLADTAAEANARSTGDSFYADVVVDREDKSHEIAKTLTWSADGKTLTVTFNTIKSSVYTVGLSTAAKLTDLNGVPWDSSKYPPNAAIGSVRGTQFSTNWRGLAGTPTISLVADTFDFNNDTCYPFGCYSKAPTLDWLPTSGAKYYHVFCAVWQVWPDGTTNRHPQMGDGAMFTAVDSTYTDNTYCEYDQLGDEFPGFTYNFVENNNVKLKYVYTVTAVNVDENESPLSNAVEVVDNVKPKIPVPGGPTPAIPATLAAGASTNNVFTFLLSEPMDEATVESGVSISATGTPASGALTLAVKSVVYNSATRVATVTLTATNAGTADAAVHPDYVLLFTAKDVAQNGMDAKFDEWAIGAPPTRTPPVTNTAPF